MQEQLIKGVEAASEPMQKALDYLTTHPETGFKEWKATAYLAAEYRALGYDVKEAGDIPGFYVDVDTGKPGPRVLVLGELDGLPVPGHPNADPETCAAHACGHNAQSAALLGVASALADPAALADLSGSIRLCAVPAEELVELNDRESLRQSGVIHYLGGKQEFLYRGYFDDCDLAFMIHTGGGEHRFQINASMNGCIMKTAEFIGKAAHAAAPSSGVNALDAATLALNAINALRTTFREPNFTRVHPIFTEAGRAVNAVPDRVRMENQVRGASVEACKKENLRVNRAVASAAAAIGANVHLRDIPGYLPAKYDPNLCETAIEAFSELVGAENVVYNRNPLRQETGCTDMNDIASVMPAVHCYGSGAKGAGHSPDAHIANFACACVESAKAQVLLLQKLLENGAERAAYIVENANVTFPDRKAYFAYQESIFMDREVVEYCGDGSVVLHL